MARALGDDRERGGIGGVVDVVKRAAMDFNDDDAMSYAAAVAFYAALSLSPLVLLFLWAAGSLGAGAQASMVREIERALGPGAGESVRQIVAGAAERPSARSIAGLVGMGTLVFSATAVFAQLQRALNVIWDVRAKPVAEAAPAQMGLWGRIGEYRAVVWAQVRKRLLSLGMVVTLGFLLLVSMVASALLSAVMGRWMTDGSAGWEVVNALVSLGVFAVLFAVMFRYLPDVRIPWRAVWGGAAVTAVLFVLGKFLLGLYLGRGTVGAGYGAAGSVVAMLVWVYYAAIIVFVGAEITQAWAAARGLHVEPEAYAERVKRDPSGNRSGEGVRAG